MRRFPILSVTLAVAVGLSIGLSYMLLFNPRFFIDSVQQSPVQSPVNDTAISQQVDKATHTLQDALFPTQLYVYDGERYYQAQDDVVLKQIITALEAQPNELSDLTVIKNQSYYDKLYQNRHVGIGFASAIPVSLMSHLMTLPSDNEVQFAFDQLVLLEDDHDAMYAVNQAEQSYMRIPFNSQLDITALHQLVANNKDNWIESQWVPIANGKALLPKVAPQIATQVYTLRKQAESYFIGTFFGTENYTITDSGDTNEKKYKTIVLEMDINSDSQLYAAKSESYKKRQSNELAQLITDSFNDVQRFENWPKGIRYNQYVETTNAATSSVFYRRYLEGYPVISDASPYYATMKFMLSPKVTQFNGSLLSLRSHITDKSVMTTLPTVEEVVSQLTDAGFKTTDFTRIEIGYEWQAGMENYQLATFIPKWFVMYDGKYFSVERVVSGELTQYIEKASTKSEEAKTNDETLEEGSEE